MDEGIDEALSEGFTGDLDSLDAIEATHLLILLEELIEEGEASTILGKERHVLDGLTMEEH